MTVLKTVVFKIEQRSWPVHIKPVIGTGLHRETDSFRLRLVEVLRTKTKPLPYKSRPDFCSCWPPKASKDPDA